jgi:hypothetical protein
MADIITREVGATAKGSPLTNVEIDTNFINLNEAKPDLDVLKADYEVAYTPSVSPTLSSDFTENEHKRYEQYGLEPKTILQQWDVARNSTATYFDANGVLQTAGINEPRIDYDPATGECRGLLVEEQATRLNKYATDFSLMNPTGVTVAATGGNLGVLPETKLTMSEVDEFHVVRPYTAAVVGDGLWRASVIVKAAGAKYVSLTSKNAYFRYADFYARFNLESGQVVDDYSGMEPEIIHMGGGVYRCSILIANAGNTTSHFSMLIENTVSAVPQMIAGNGVDGVFVYHAQVENINRVTSPILGEGTAVTRVQDIITPTV